MRWCGGYLPPTRCAAEIVARHFPALLDTGAACGQPVRWLERYPSASGWVGEYGEVTFVPWRPRSRAEATALADDLAPHRRRTV
jgi:hypothetical protein